MGTVTLFKSKMSDSRVLLHSECHITTFLEGRPIKNQFKSQIELYLVSVQRRKWLYAHFKTPRCLQMIFNDFKGDAKGKIHTGNHKKLKLEFRLTKVYDFFVLVLILCFVRKWRRSWDLCLNLRSHSSQLKGFSPVWIRICDLSVWRCRNLENMLIKTDFNRCWHGDALDLLEGIPVAKFTEYGILEFNDFELNLVPQTWHGYGFSPVWMRIWALRWATWTNRALHVSHLYGFSPLWIRKWVFKFAGRLNWASQIGHLYGLLPKRNGLRFPLQVWAWMRVF